MTKQAVSLQVKKFIKKYGNSASQHIRSVPLIASDGKTYCTLQYDYAILEYLKSRMNPLYSERYVYVMVAPALNRYKIGYAANVERRVCTVNGQSPCEVVLLAKVKTENYSSMERRVQNQFAKFWVKGEWFELDKERAKDLVDFLASEAPTNGTAITRAKRNVTVAENLPDGQ
jgi:hypothetical protein